MQAPKCVDDPPRFELRLPRLDDLGGNVKDLDGLDLMRVQLEDEVHENTEALVGVRRLEVEEQIHLSGCFLVRS